MNDLAHTVTSPPRLVLTDCSFAYEQQSVLQSVDATVESGEFLGIVGPNGAGKTTLLRLLSGQRAPAKGTATADGSALHSMPALQRARLIAVVPQSEAVMFPWPVYSFVMLGRHPHSRSFGFERPDDHRAVEAAMRMVGIAHLAARRATDLSGGELHRVLIARALAQDTPVLLLDEPNAHLDIRHQVELFELLARLHASSGRSIVIITHDLNLASMYCDRLLLMDGGRIAAHGAPREVLRDELIARHFGVRVGIEDAERPHVRLLRPEGNS
ncbi:MAG: ABC transporter ATP-binding protein [Bacteroidota bacterium]|nr:ABC transporter ATP-binding protein [Bacteroidota bacterium]